MSSRKPSLDEVKVDVRSILLTAPKGLTLKQFCGSYKTILGSFFPFREFNYKSAEDFLRSLPDTVIVSWCSISNDYLLRGIADEKTAHIEKLVSKQKITKRKSLPPPRRRQMDYFYYNVPPRFQTAYNPILPASVKQDINILLRQYDEGISYQNFEMAYRRRYGREFNHQRMGFSSMEQCLNSIAGVHVKVRNGEARIFKSCDDRKNVSDVDAASVSETGNSGVVKSYSPITSRAEAVPRQIASPKPLSQMPRMLPTSINRVQNWLNNTSLRYDDEPEGPIDKIGDVHHPESVNIEHEQEVADDDNSGISKIMQENFKKILQKNPHGTWASDFPIHYQELTGYKFDLQELGYYTLIQLTEALPKIFRRIQPDGCISDWLLFDAKSSISSEHLQTERSLASRLNTSIDVSDELISNIRKILEANPEGVYVDDFLHLYSLNCENSLGLSETGCGSVEKFLLQIADRVPLILDYSGSRKKAKIGRNSSSVPFYLTVTPKTASLGNEIPEDAVLPGMQYEWQSLPASSSNSYFQMCIGTIVDPSLMWIQSISKDTTGALDELMSKLDNCYRGPRDNCYLMREEHIIIGTICAGIWSGDGTWHRVSITGMSSDTETVDVSFVDYGTNGRILRSNLRYLRKQFTTLPAQGIKSRMAYIKPVNGVSWNPKIRDNLLSKYSNKILMAEIVQSTHYPGFWSLWICDVMGSEDVYLNKQLIDEGYAAFLENDLPETPTAPLSDPLCVLQQYIHNPYITVPQQGSINAVRQEGLSPAFTTKLQLQPGTVPSPPASKELVTESAYYLTSLLGIEPSPVTIVLLQQLLMSGMSIPKIIELLGSSGSSVLPNNFGSSAFTANVPGFSSSSAFAQGNSVAFNTTSRTNNPLRFCRNPAVTTPDSGVCDNSFSPPVAQITSVSPEIFEDDDDDEDLEELCAQYSISTKRFVKRAYLKGGGMFHIIVVDGVPHVTSADISLMLWSNESSDCLDRRLRGKQITIASNKISELVYPEIFYQLKCYEVKGIKRTDHNTSTNLIPLKNVIDILNIFGHPSTSIRGEIANYVRNFNANDSIWKSFSLSDGEHTDKSSIETDNGKFNKMCIFDLKSTLKGLQYRRLTLMNKPSHSQNVDPNEEIKKIESQCKLYEERIKEIESVCETFDFECEE